MSEGTTVEEILGEGSKIFHKEAHDEIPSETVE